MTEKQNPLVGGGVKVWPLNDEDAPPASVPPCVAGIYLRISDDDEGLELGVKRQDGDVLKKAIEAGATEVRRYCDNDIGASTRSKKPRPDYDRLMTDANSGELDLIAYYTNSRLTRRPAEYEGVIKTVEATSVRLVSVKSGHIDLTTADGRMLGRILAAADAAEAERIGERVTRKHEERREHGLPHGGGPILGYLPPDPARGIGYMTHRDPRAVKYLNDGADMALNDAGWTAIMDYWNAEGFHRLNGTPWRTRDEVKATLLAPKRAGLVAHADKIIGAGTWPAIISVEKWEKLSTKFPMIEREQGNANRQGKRRRSNPALAKPGQGARKHKNSGLIICGRCAAKMRVKQPGGSRQDMYVCAKGIGGCGKMGRNKAWVDGLINAYVIARIEEEYATTATEAVDVAQVERLKKEISDREALIDEALKTAKDPSIPGYTFADAGRSMRELRLEIDDFKRQLGEEISKEKVITTSKDELIATWLDETPATIEARAAIGRRYIEHVMIHALPRKGRWTPASYPADCITIIGK
ncbi:recombinase family protein [Nonomuraea sp. NPDC051191]|uniref:recombinase family protein n=1 Tax=Nonomuraea sp. NPDC051191 TaxID=3364372 RepID=UPI0037B152DC